MIPRENESVTRAVGRKIKRRNGENHLIEVTESPRIRMTPRSVAPVTTVPTLRIGIMIVKRIKRDIIIVTTTTTVQIAVGGVENFGTTSMHTGINQPQNR